MKNISYKIFNKKCQQIHLIQILISFLKNPTDQDVKDFFRLSAEDSQRRQEAELKKRMTETPEVERIKYDYLSKLNKREDEIPDFMKFVFIDPAIPTSEKDKFLYKFCIRYLSDLSFKNEVYGKELFFRNRILERIVENDFDPSIDYSNGDSRYFVPIGEIQTSYRYAKVAKEVPTITNNYPEPNGEIFTVTRPTIQSRVVTLD